MESGDCGLLGDTRPPNEGRSLRLDALVLLELELIFADVALVAVLGARLRARVIPSRVVGIGVGGGRSARLLCRRTGSIAAS